MTLVSHWILASRPKTLPLGLFPVFLGFCHAKLDAYHEGVAWGVWQWVSLPICIIYVLCIQISCNFFNDAIDYQKGADTEARFGFTRACQAGLLTSKQVLTAACVLLVLAALVGGYTVWHLHSWSLFFLGALSLYFSFGYTGGPFPLAYIGLAELFVVIFFGLVAVCGTYMVTDVGPLHKDEWLSGLMLGFLAACLVAVNNLRDLYTDCAVHKRTLATRIGEKPMRCVVSVFFFIPYLLLIFNTHKSFWWLPYLAFPFSVHTVQKMWKTPVSPAMNQLFVRAVVILMIVTLLKMISYY